MRRSGPGSVQNSLNGGPSGATLCVFAGAIIRSAFCAMRDAAGRRDTLMTRRDKILNEIIPSVVPSTYPEEKFKKLDKWKPGDHYTTCGAMPTYVAKQLGVAEANAKDGLLDYGLLTMRNAAITADAWVNHNIDARKFANSIGMLDSINLPKPGDFYMLCSGMRHENCNRWASPKKGDEGKYHGATIEHVGVIKRIVSPTEWLTADAGQSKGGMQAADYVTRNFDPATGNMTGEVGRNGRPMRRLCGWLDADLYPFLS